VSGFSVAGWVLLAAVWLLVVIHLCRTLRQVWTELLVRCPETGAVSVIRVRPATRRDFQSAALEVRHCGLWPGEQNCRRGCLHRFAETSPGYPVSLKSLRPFDP
jgi:hypothetical protein